MKDECRPIRLEVISNPVYLSIMRNVAYELAKISGLTEEEAKEFRLVIDEACTNIIRHSYHYDYRRPIILNFFLCDDRIEVLIQDYGKKVNPSEIRSRDIDEIRPGGLGVYIINKLMDVMEYAPTDEGPRLRLVKYKNRKG